MKSLTKELWMEVPERRAIVSIHRDVAQLVDESGVQDGLFFFGERYAHHRERLY